MDPCWFSSTLPHAPTGQIILNLPDWRMMQRYPLTVSDFGKPARAAERLQWRYSRMAIDDRSSINYRGEPDLSTLHTLGGI